MKILHCLLSVSAFIACACSAVPPTTPTVSEPLRFPGHTERIAPPSEKRGALSLSSRNILEMPPEIARNISAIDFWHGQARLTDGQCLRMEHDRRTGELTAAAVYADPSQCDHLINYPRLVSGRCSADEKNVTIATWRVGCRNTGNSRSVIEATRLDDPTQKLELASLADEELIAVGVMGLHNQGVIRTLGIRADGKVALSYYLWFDGPYRAPLPQ